MIRRCIWQLLPFLLLLPIQAQGADLDVRGAWVGAPISHTATTAAAFADISNLSQQSVNIVGAASDYAQKVQIHRIEHSEGLVRMVAVNSIEIPAGETISLNAHGLHLMLIGLQGMPWQAEHIKIELFLEGGETHQAMFAIKALNQPAEEGHSHH